MNPAMYDADGWEDELQWECDINGLSLCPSCNTTLILGFDEEHHGPVYMCYRCGWSLNA